MMTSVVIVVPHQGWIHNSVVKLLLEMQESILAKTEFSFPQYRPVEWARARAVRSFLNTGKQFLLFIDADNPPTKNPLRRLAEDLDVVGFPTPYVDERRLFWNVFMLDPASTRYQNVKPATGLREVDAVGSGCMLIKRDVLRTLDGQPFAFEYNEDGTVKKAGDINFCEKVRQRGFTVWADWDTPCRHYKEVDLSERPT